MTEPVDHLILARTELGEPEALFQVSRGRFLTKLALGLTLVVYGVTALAVRWIENGFRFGFVEHFFIIAPALFGVSLLGHMYRNRGLFVLVYPTGLLRLRRGEVDSFPWAEIDHIKLTLKTAEPTVERDDAGKPVVAWLPVEVPTIKIWEAGLTAARVGGATAHFGPALADYDQLAEQVQRRTFAELWPAVWERFRAGVPILFDEIEVSADGLRHDTKFLPWRRVKEVTVGQGRLGVKQEGKWSLWLFKEVAALPNLHVLVVLIEEARRLHGALASESQPQAGFADHAAM